MQQAKGLPCQQASVSCGQSGPGEQELRLAVPTACNGGWEPKPCKQIAGGLRLSRHPRCRGAADCSGRAASDTTEQARAS